MRTDDAFADAGDDRFLGRTADELIQVRPHRDAGLHLELNAVLGHGVERRALAVLRRAIDHARVNAGLHGFEHVAAGQVDGRRPLEVEIDDLGLAGGDHRANHERHVAAGQIVGFERLGRDAFAIVDAGLHGHDLAARDHGRVHFAERHPEQIEDADAGAGGDRLDPQPEVAGEDRKERERDDQRAEQQHEPERVIVQEAPALCEQSGW